jgi:hypothetical protein
MTTKEIFFFVLGGVLVWFWLSERPRMRRAAAAATMPAPGPAAPNACGGPA